MKVILFIVLFCPACLFSDFDAQIEKQILSGLNPRMAVEDYLKIVFPLEDRKIERHRYSSFLGYLLSNKYKLHENVFSYNVDNAGLAAWVMEAFQSNEFPFTKDMISNLTYQLYRNKDAVHFVGTFEVKGEVTAKLSFVLDEHASLIFMGVLNRRSNFYRDALPVFVRGGDVYVSYTLDLDVVEYLSID